MPSPFDAETQITHDSTESNAQMILFVCFVVAVSIRTFFEEVASAILALIGFIVQLIPVAGAARE